MRKTLFIITLVLLTSFSLFAQNYFNSNLRYTVGFFLGDNNDRKDNGIPLNSSIVTALALDTDMDNVIVGTSATKGDSPYLLMYKSNRMFTRVIAKLDTIFGNQTRVTKLITGKDAVYGCTGEYLPEDGMTYKTWSENYPDREWSARNRDSILKAIDFKGSHLFSLKDGKVYDLGIVEEKSNIISMTFNSYKSEILILTSKGSLLSYKLSDKKTTSIKEIVSTRKHHGKTTATPSFGLDIVLDTNGILLGTDRDGKVWQYDTHKKEFSFLQIVLPHIAGRNGNNKVSKFTIDKKTNTVYGATTMDGILFAITPDRRKVKNLGKPNQPPQIRGMTMGKDDKVYLTSGCRDGFVHLISYDPAESNYLDYGLLESIILRSGVQGFVYQIGPLLTHPDGSIFIGEEDRKGHLYRFTPPRYPEDSNPIWRRF